MGLLDLFKRDDPAPVKARRKYAAAIANRLTSNWHSIDSSIDAELKGDLDKLRGRARDLAANNDYARKFLTMVMQNIIGPHGFKLQCEANDGPDRPDNLANDAIEGAFERWCRRGSCEVRGQMSFADLQRAIVKAVARDGEAILLQIRGADAGNADGYALQLLDISRLATRLNRARTGGTNAIVMGVEVNQYGRPVAYHLYDKLPEHGGFQGAITRYPADQVLHLFLVDTPEQTRGLPWMHAGMLRLHRLKSYEDAALVAAQVGASNLGFFTTQEGYAKGVLDDGGSDSFLLGTDGQPLQSVEAGQFGILPEGYDFKSFDPNYPQDQYPSFVQAQLRGFASGVGVGYHNLANDLEGVNFSSIRSGTLEERDQWMALQDWLVHAFLTPVYEAWLASALVRGIITMPNGSALPAAKLDKFMAHHWQGRRWQWVDPLKDVEALARAIELRIMSPQHAAAQLGMDLDDVLRDIARFHSLAESVGVAVADPKPGDPALVQQEEDRKLAIHQAELDISEAETAKREAARLLLLRQAETQAADTALKATQIKRELADIAAAEAEQKAHELDQQLIEIKQKSERDHAELRQRMTEREIELMGEAHQANLAVMQAEREAAQAEAERQREHTETLREIEVQRERKRDEAAAAERDAKIIDLQAHKDALEELRRGGH